VHNLPASEAAGIMQELSAYTAEPEPDRLISNLARLNSHPDLLLVLNHPLWDEKGIGLAQHRETLRNLLKLCGCQFHALELNGLRSWHENQQVIRLAWEMDLPLTGGGDRHGREPNSILNLSRGTNLIEFVHELRYQRRSHLVFMPQYHEPLTLRTIQTVIDILRDYPEVFEGRRTWPERVFYRAPDSATAVPISAIWPNGNEPRIFRAVTFATRLAQTWGVQSALRLLFRDRDLWRSASSDLPSFRSLEMDGKAAI
ncbi:MAG: hypothetical protein JO061_10600, partial [Acidobacteriaceae bacterium]|nr:hypothetical protein [Acidobacteriaceae bacterium]